VDLFVVVAGVLTPGRPAEPVVLGVAERVLGIDLLWQVLVRGVPGEHERDALALGQRELRHRHHVLAVHLYRRAVAERIGAGDGDAGMVDPADPGDDLAEVEADHELRAHRDGAAEALHDADDVRRLAPWRHEVDRPHGALVGLEDRLEDQRVVPIPPARPANGRVRGEEPAAVVAPAQQGCEASARVEPGKAAPVDRPFAADERRRLQVSDECVVLDLGHERLPTLRASWCTAAAPSP
jgi:hypothetical protein